MRTDHVEALGVMLATARIMSEERFDREAAGELRLVNDGNDLPAIKQHLIDRGRLYRLEVRGRSYLAAIPVIGDVHGLQICYHWQVASLLETMASVLGGTASKA